MQRRILAPFAVLALTIASQATKVSLTGTVMTVRTQYALRGVRVSLAQGHLLSNDTTGFDGTWTIKGEIVGVVPRAHARHPLSRNLSVTDGHLGLRFDGHDLRGRALGNSPMVFEGASAAAPRTQEAGVVLDTLLYTYRNTVIARAPIALYDSSDLYQLVDTSGLVGSVVTPGPAGVAHARPLGWQQFAQVASGMKYIQSRNRRFRMGLKDSLVKMDSLAVDRHEVRFSYDFWIDSVETRASDFAEVMTWALDRGLIVLNTDESGYRWVTTPSGRTLFTVVPVLGSGSTLQMDYDGTKKCFASTGEGGVPINESTIYAAMLHANFLSQMHGLESVYDTMTWSADFTKNGYRLPTEAEWEFAARGGVTTEYPWGDTWDASLAGRVMNMKAELWPVAFLQPNAYGLYDMQGNALEFVNDLCVRYTTNDVVDPIGPASGATHALRGASASNVMARIGTRQPASDNSLRGFRLALPIR